MNDTLIALMREVTGPAISDGKLQVLITLVTSFMGRKGGRPPKPPKPQIEVTEPVTPETQTGYVTPFPEGGGGVSVSESVPDISDPSKPLKRRRYNMMSESPGFRDFWALYPRRVAKQDAIRAWKPQFDADLNLRQRMLDELRWQTAHAWVDTPLDKIPYPASWLNGKRWEDERQLTNGHAKQRPFGRPSLDHLLAERSKP